MATARLAEAIEEMEALRPAEEPRQEQREEGERKAAAVGRARKEERAKSGRRVSVTLKHDGEFGPARVAEETSEAQTLPRLVETFEGDEQK
jgi:hypothetical protein